MEFLLHTLHAVALLSTSRQCNGMKLLTAVLLIAPPTSKRETTAPYCRMCCCASHMLVICTELNCSFLACWLGVLQLPVHS
jgi:hypothetical protein